MQCVVSDRQLMDPTIPAAEGVKLASLIPPNKYILLHNDVTIHTASSLMYDSAQVYWKHKSAAGDKLFCSGTADFVPVVDFELLHNRKGARGRAVGWGTVLQVGKVAGSIPDGVIGIFQWHSPSGRTMASNKNEYQEYFLGVKAAGA